MKKIKYLIVFAVLLISSLLFSEEFKIARLHYDGGGDWYNDPDMIPNLAEFVNEELNTNIIPDQAVVKPADRKIADYPFIFMTGHGNVKLSEREIESLRKYLLNGGFLYADDDYGMDESFRILMQKVFPEKELVELPRNHNLYNCYFTFENGLPKIHEHDKKRPQGFAIFDEYGRMMVYYTYESNISDGWAGPQVHNNPPNVREKALKMGLNLIYYVLTK